MRLLALSVISEGKIFYVLERLALNGISCFYIKFDIQTLYGSIYVYFPPLPDINVESPN